MKAKLIIQEKVVLQGGYIVQLVLWELPEQTAERPHRFKYRLYFGDNEGNCIVRYDNERGKGDHKHIGDQEVLYDFTDKDKLIDDFYHDIEKFFNANGVRL